MSGSSSSRIQPLSEAVYTLILLLMIAIAGCEQRSPGGSATSQFLRLSLKSLSELTEAETNLGLEAGEHRFSDIPFDVGWKATTRCSHLPERPMLIELNANVPRPIAVHLLLQGGWALKDYEGAVIGIVSLRFTDGRSLDTPLKLGFNIRDWNRDNPVAVTSASSPTLKVAWEGAAENGEGGRIDLLTIEIPAPYSQSTLASIVVTDISEASTGGINPCVHLVAATVRYLGSSR